jgi:hypothetical protein
VSIGLGADPGGLLGAFPYLVFFKAVYDDVDKMRVILLIAQKYFEEYVKDVEFYRGKIPDRLIPDWEEYLWRALEFRLPTFKHRAFLSEQEIRLVVRWGDTVKREFKKIYFRERGGKLVPYLLTSELVQNTPLLNINSITIGPQHEK